MNYSLRSLMIAGAVGPPLVAATWLSLRIEWSDEALLAVAIACAIPYWVGIGILVAKNRRKPVGWIVGVVAGIIWPALFVMSFMQLAVVIPVWSLLSTSGSHLEKPMPLKTIFLASGLTLAFIFWVAAVSLIHS